MAHPRSLEARCCRHRPCLFDTEPPFVTAGGTISADFSRCRMLFGHARGIGRAWAAYDSSPACWAFARC